MTDTIDKTNLQYLATRDRTSGEWSHTVLNSGPLFAAMLTTTTTRFPVQDQVVKDLDALIRNIISGCLDQPIKRNRYVVSNCNTSATLQIVCPVFDCVLMTSKFSDFEYENTELLRKEFKSILQSLTSK